MTEVGGGEKVDKVDAAAVKKKKAAAKAAFLSGLSAGEREVKESALRSLDVSLTALW